MVGSFLEVLQSGQPVLSCATDSTGPGNSHAAFSLFLLLDALESLITRVLYIRDPGTMFLNFSKKFEILFWSFTSATKTSGMTLSGHLPMLG